MKKHKTTNKESKKNRQRIADMDMLPRNMAAAALIVAKMADVPNKLKKCQKAFIETNGLFIAALGSHIICHAKLEIAKEELADAKKTIEALAPQKMINEMKEEETPS